jgi:hypothetical protein
MLTWIRTTAAAVVSARRRAPVAAALAFAALSLTAAPADAQSRYDRYDPPPPAHGASPYRGSSKDDGYPEPVPPPAHYEPGPRHGHDSPYGAPRPKRTAERCFDKHGIRDALNAQGWRHFDEVTIRDDIAHMTADDDRGRRFEVKFDTCTGEVVAARPVYGDGRGHAEHDDEAEDEDDRYADVRRPRAGVYGDRRW